MALWRHREVWELISICSGNGLLPIRCPTIIWPIAELSLSIGLIVSLSGWRNCSLKAHKSIKKIYLKTSFAKWWPFCFEPKYAKQLNQPVIKTTPCWKVESKKSRFSYSTWYAYHQKYGCPQISCIIVNAWFLYIIYVCRHRRNSRWYLGMLSSVWSVI